MEENNQKSEIEMVMDEAEKGNAEAQGWLGLQYIYGKGVDLDYSKAAYWFKLAADQGNVTGLNSLGHCLLHGLGVKTDVKEGYKLTKAAADLGDIHAYEGMGYCYYNGVGVIKNKTRAKQWWERAAGGGEKEAKENLVKYFGHKTEDLSLEPYEMLKNAFNSTIFDYFSELLDRDARYNSLWKEINIVGAEDIAQHLWQTSKKVFEGNAVMRAKLAEIIGVNKEGLDSSLKVGHYCVELTTHDGIMIILLEGNDPTVSRMDICKADNFEYKLLSDPFIMSKEEVHQFGIQIVLEQMEKEGYTIVQCDVSLDVFPQIMAEKDEGRYVILVATEIAPFTGALAGKLRSMIIDFAKEYDAIPCFASVGIAEVDEEHFYKSIARRGKEYRIKYSGLELMETKNNLN